MAIVKFNLPVVTSVGIPNINNLSDEANTITTLASKLTRSNSGQISYTSASSGIVYATVDNIADSTIYNKGETGLYNLLLREMDEYIFTAEDIAKIEGIVGTGTISTTGWVANGGDYALKLNVAITNVTDIDVIDVSIDKDSVDIGKACNLCPTNESYNGGVTFFAKTAPSGNISFTYKY